ncbi:FecR family protein [Niastella koreensis]|uniref:FecR family protein n=1 Tax=Niastella koreensis TaxID=354356 RepID=UPI0010563989|nr:FecR domain-containing protein [Niastella koreensis]
MLQLIDRFLAGKTSAEEEQLLHNYFNSFQQSSAWDEEQLGSRDAMEQKLRSRLRESIGNNSTDKKGRLFRFSKQQLLAAATIVVLLGGYLLWNQLSSLLHRPASMQQAITGLQERKQVQLADGTVIWLEPGSSLHYPAQFNDSTREINFTGEAFFDVAKNPAKPFIIHTGTIRTRVLGTSFTVKAYTPVSQEVTVVTGRVMVQADSKTKTNIQPLTVTPNQQASWNNQRRQLEKKDLPSTLYYAQRRYGKFIYQGETVSAVLDDIRHQYNVQIQYDAAIGSCTFYGDFDLKQPVGNVLSTLAAALNTTLIKEQEQNSYRLTGGGCNSTSK